MLKGIYLGICFSFMLVQTFGQNTDTLLKPNSYKPNRMKWAAGVSIGGYTTTMGMIYAVWYAKEQQCKFRWFDDSKEWAQLDKCGHAFSAYQESRMGIKAMQWTGLSRKKAIWIGGLYGIFMQHPLEAFDGIMCTWGASAPDLAANTFGSALAISQELAWDEQRIEPKFSAHLTSMAATKPNLLGKTIPQRLLKDYNGQTYWLTINIHDFLGVKAQQWYPKWLALSVGYGAEGLIGGYGKDPWSEIKAREYRQWYLSLEINLRKIKTGYRVLDEVIHGLNLFKVPLPTVEFSQKGIRWHPIYF